MTAGKRTPLDRGTLVVSIDTELAWGSAYKGTPAASENEASRSAAERQIVDAILDLFAMCGISATWAVVGHLFLEGCRPVEGRKHPDVIRPNYVWFQGDWFDPDPTSDVETDPMWYAPDIIKRITRATPSQEIGCHSFSHLMVGEEGCSASAFASDLDACSQAAGNHDIRLQSFVFPRNSVGHLDVLADHGYRAYRGIRPAPFPNLSALTRSMVELVDRICPLAGSVVSPYRSGRLWNVPATNFYGPSQRAKYIPFSLWVGQQMRRMGQAVRHRSLFHLWFHSHNLLHDPDRSLAGLQRIFTRAAQLRDGGELDIFTMGNLADRLDLAEAATVSRSPKSR